MFYLLLFGTAQQDLTEWGTGILGVVLVEKMNSISGWIDLGKQGWLAQLGPEWILQTPFRGQ